jgi:hypothetical protein
MDKKCDNMVSPKKNGKQGNCENVEEKGLKLWEFPRHTYQRNSLEETKLHSE